MKKIILTFDDGPSKCFEKLLNYLIENNHKAIFFLVGKNINKNNEKLIIKAIKKGFLIGNHSYSHPGFRWLSFEKAKEEILKTEEIIEKLYKKAKVKRPVKIFRFPSFREGWLNKRKFNKFLEEEGYENPYFENQVFQRIVTLPGYGIYHFFQRIFRMKNNLYCNLDPADWNEKTSWKQIKKVLDKSKSGDILNLHDQSKRTFELTKKICNYLFVKGFKLAY